MVIRGETLRAGLPPLLRLLAQWRAPPRERSAVLHAPEDLEVGLARGRPVVPPRVRDGDDVAGSANLNCRVSLILPTSGGSQLTQRYLSGLASPVSGQSWLREEIGGV